jgi:hypothetical protein
VSWSFPVPTTTNSLIAVTYDKDPSGPSVQQMEELAQMTLSHSTNAKVVSQTLFGMFNDATAAKKPLFGILTSNSHDCKMLVKALRLLDYCLRNGSQLVVDCAKRQIKSVERLTWLEVSGADARNRVTPGKLPSYYSMLHLTVLL